jgi:predicted nucleic acid-binding Zn ribbon protein
MHCPHCGNNIPQNSTFCLHCGRQIYAPPSRTATTGTVAAASVWTVVILTVVGVAAVGIGILVYGELQRKNSPDAGTSTSSGPASLFPVLSQPHVIVNDSFAVGARQYASYSFTTTGPTHVKGSFTAQGGRNDIDVALFTAEGYVNFQNGHAGSTYYQSPGYVTAGSIDINIPAGTYYLVFINTAALLTNKVVHADVVATY